MLDTYVVASSFTEKRQLSMGSNSETSSDEVARALFWSQSIYPKEQDEDQSLGGHQPLTCPSIVQSPRRDNVPFTSALGPFRLACRPKCNACQLFQLIHPRGDMWKVPLQVIPNYPVDAGHVLHSPSSGLLIVIVAPFRYRVSG